MFTLTYFQIGFKLLGLIHILCYLHNKTYYILYYIIYIIYYILYIIPLSFSFFFLPFLGQQLWHVEVPQLGVQLEL